MSNTKFTPGPWVVNDRAKMNVRSMSDDNIASCGGELEYDEACANAALIAAAPEMYAAMQSFCKDFQNDYVMPDGRIVDNPQDFLVQNYNMFQAILSKANGEK